jgi:integrase
MGLPLAPQQHTEARMLTIRSVANLPLNSVEWDEGKGSVSGLGARRRTGKTVVYVLKYRTLNGRQRWHTIGRHGAPWTPNLARDEARRLLGEVVKGDDPAAAKRAKHKAATVGELCDAYLEAAKAGRILTRSREVKKASTLVTDKGRIERHIKPLLGWLKVAAVTRDDVESFMHAVTAGETKAWIKTGKHGLARVTGGRGTATRTMGLLGAIFSYGVERKLRTDNPVRGIQRHKDGQRNRRLSETEYAALGDALRTMSETAWPIAVAATKFLALTGWRRGEMLTLKWSEVDLVTRTAQLSDTKTGASMRPLSHSTCDVLRAIPRLGELVFPASTGVDKIMRGFHKIWLRVAKHAAFGADLTPHVLRHSFASVAADLGFSELTIAALIGHKKTSITSKYAHHADAVLLQAADVVSDRIAGLMGEARASGVVVGLSRRSA